MHALFLKGGKDVVQIEIGRNGRFPCIGGCLG